MERLAEFQADIDRYGWPMEVAMAEGNIAADVAKVFLIRHGLSLYN